MDDYERRRRELDLIFQELEDREVAARREEWISALEAYGTSRKEMNAIRRDLLKMAKAKGKTDGQAQQWADAKLRRFAALFEESDEHE
jgi:hypothetical protein